MRAWIEGKRVRAGKDLKRYASIEDAADRMQEANAHLSPAQVRHLTEHGVLSNEDGTYSWKFDRYFRSWPPYDIPEDDVHRLWSRITCPALMIYGRQSPASNATEDGRSAHFKTARFEFVDNAGHWVHHDQLELFMAMTEGFLGEP